MPSALLFVVAHATTNPCFYFGGFPCLPNIDGEGSATFSFKPLFPKDSKFVAAFDSMSTEEAKNKASTPRIT
jgi:hypothetical protein